MFRCRAVVFCLFFVFGLLSVLAVAQTVQAQYPSYSYPATTPTPTSEATATPVPTAKSSGTNLVLYEGPLTSGTVGSTIYGFGDTATNITSPGPTLYLQKGVTYTMTVYNLDPSMMHSWEIVATKAVSNTPLWGAGIDITNYIPSGSFGSVTFTANETGNFYYVCTRPGHIDLGMYGNVVVTEEPIPEFPSPAVALLTLVILVATTALVIQIKNISKKNKLTQQA